MSSVFGSSGDKTPNLDKLEEDLSKQQTAIIKTGIPGFDESLGQGLSTGNLYLVSGSLGSISNQFVQQILYNTVISKRKVTYYTVENASTDIINDMQVFGMNVQQYVDDGSWVFVRTIPPNMKKIVDALPEIPLEHRIELDTSFTKLMNHFHDTVKEGRNTALHLPLLVRNFSLEEIQNLLFFMIGVARRFGGIHFLLITEGAHEQNTMVSIKDMVDSVFEITTATRGTEVENVVSILKIRNMLPKNRVIRLAQRENGLATETIRRIQ